MQVLPNLTPRRIDAAFKVVMGLKAVNAILQIIGGMAVLALSKASVVGIVSFLTRGELYEDPQDWISNTALSAAQHFSIDARGFIAAYLLSHGIIKILLISSLLNKRLWSYPASLLVTVLFMVYQLYRYAHTHAISLIVLTVFDLIVLWLIWKEYRLLMRSLHR
jgi:uncharacterized membrane protein